MATSIDMFGNGLVNSVTGDVTLGYHQIEIAEEEKGKTAFVLPNGFTNIEAACPKRP